MENNYQPAFPVDFASEKILVFGPGLSKREYIAAKAMQGLLADTEFSPILTDEDMQKDAKGTYAMKEGYWCGYPHAGGTHSLKTTFEQRVARIAVKYADALLAELEK